MTEYEVNIWWRIETLLSYFQHYFSALKCCVVTHKIRQAVEAHAGDHPLCLPAATQGPQLLCQLLILCEACHLVLVLRYRLKQNIRY